MGILKKDASAGGIGETKAAWEFEIGNFTDGNWNGTIDAGDPLNWLWYERKGRGIRDAERAEQQPTSQHRLTDQERHQLAAGVTLRGTTHRVLMTGGEVYIRKVT